MAAKALHGGRELCGTTALESVTDIVLSNRPERSHKPLSRTFSRIIALDGVAPPFVPTAMAGSVMARCSDDRAPHSGLAPALLVVTCFPQVNYKKNMPDIELLMEAWPPEVEEILDNVNSLTPELDIPLEDYARMVSE